ncbi:ABC transporter ATP-binding protein [Stappia sp.]|uniref:ABC transporter ATP-binding protein n=1 Tax=Stappia sp. TaxID=1870903 RepID=UPI003A993D7F
MSLLKIADLQIHFRTPGGVNRAVDGLSLEVDAGETVAIVGESGCGKSVTSLSILRLLPQASTRIGGRILFRGEDLLHRSQRRMRQVRGGEIGMIFQEPMTSLNPVWTVGRQIEEALLLHENMSRAQARKRAVELLREVGISSPEHRVGQYPHELSGGMRQRVMITIAMACNPALLIADEPTTALDVTIQAQVLDLMRHLQKRRGSAVLMITHDLGVVAEFAERVVVMYAGRKIEEAPVGPLFARPMHPYTGGLLAAVPKIGSARGSHRSRLAEIPGSVPDLRLRHEGCIFAPRCARVQDTCRTVAPALLPQGEGHSVACHYPLEAA